MVHFPNFWGKKRFSKKLGCHAQLHNSYQHPGKIQGNLMIQFQGNNQTDVRRQGSLFHGILPATSRGLASKTAIYWHLKVKDMEYNIGLTKNYCIAVSMHKTSSIHKLIQQSLGSHELNYHAHFRPDTPKNHKISFCFPEFAPPCKKSVHVINSFLRYSQFWSPVTRLATPISGHAHPKIF